MESVNAVLARKMGLAAPTSEAEKDAPPTTPMRMMRRALGRAAEETVGLSSSVLGIQQEDAQAEVLIEGGPEGWIVLGLRHGDNTGLTGVFLLDPKLRSALIEMQTMGSLLPPTEEQRPVTRTDAVMSMPFAQKLLEELALVGFGAPELDTGGYDMTPMVDLRTAGLVMMQGSYRCWRITVDFGGGEAQGEVMLALRPDVAADDAPIDPASGWSDALQGAVQDAQVEMDAVLCTLPLAIHTIEAFEVDQVIALAGTTVGSVTMYGAGSQKIATARLGQVAGKRAVRIEAHHVELETRQTPTAMQDIPQTIQGSGEPAPPQAGVPAESLAS